MATTDAMFPAEFVRTIKEHKATIIHDDGLHRHLRCANPKSWNMGFYITTWPGHLCISGDMGTFVFSRTDDMFRFHRPERELYSIDFGYWAEKLQAMDRTGHRKFSPELFRECINTDLESYIEDYELDDDQAKALTDQVQSIVLSEADEGEVRAISVAMEFTHRGRPVFQDFYEHHMHEYTYHFLWCCHAIRWAIREYDIQREQVTFLERARRSVAAAWGCLRRGSLVCLPS